MNIHHLREFITLAEVQNYLEAAEELFNITIYII